VANRTFYEAILSLLKKKKENDGIYKQVCLLSSKQVCYQKCTLRGTTELDAATTGIANAPVFFTGD